jgi:hypothetical protein
MDCTQAQGIYKIACVAGSASASNVVTVTVSQTGYCFIAGIECSLSTNKLVMVGGIGVPSSTTANWVSAVGTDPFRIDAWLTQLPPDLTIISLGINDAAVSVSAAAYIANIQTLGQYAALTGDVVLMDPFQSSGAAAAIEATYATALQSLAISKGWGYLPAILAFPYLAGEYFDANHPLPIRYARIADWVVESLGLGS